MDHLEFTAKVRRFMADHGQPMDRRSRIIKFYGEVEEFIDARRFEIEVEEAQEAIDCGVTAWCLMLAYGIENPFEAMLAKLDEAAKRPHYQAIRKRRLDE